MSDSFSQAANVRIYPGGLTSLSGSNIVNDSSVTGVHVKAALDYLSSAATAVFPFLASGLAEQDLLSYDASALTWKNRTKAAALKGTGLASLALMGGLAAGTNDIVIGTSAGTATNTGSDNIGIGTDTLDGATVALQNVIAIGGSALSGALTAAANGTVAIGSAAGLVLTSGAQNTFAGFQTGIAVMSGSGNTLVGYNTQSSASAVNNTFIGTSVGNTQVGDYNVAVGYGALNSATAAVTSCVAIGQNTLTGALTTAANGTTAVGTSVLVALTSGAQNTAFGYRNQWLITTGSNNTTVGYSVMDEAELGCSDNVGIGSHALNSVLTTNANGAVAVGKAALWALTSGARNIAVGYQAGNSLTTGSDMTILGYDADGDNAARSGCVVLGSNASATADNTLVIRVGNSSTTELKSTLAITAKGARSGAVAADTDYLTVVIGGVTRYIELKTTP